jgi:hypothetical protein
MRTMALECFKILYKLSPPCLNDLFVLKNSKYSFFQDNKMFLNWLKLAIFLKSSGRSFHKTAAAYLKEFLP